MGSEPNNKFTWVIKNFTSIKPVKIYSDPFVIGGYKWRLVAYPKGNDKGNYLSLYLRVAHSETLPPGWKIHTKFHLTVVNQLSEKLSKSKETSLRWFEQKSPALGFLQMLPYAELTAETGGYLVNEEVKIVVEIDILEVIGKSDESEEATQPLKKMKLEESTDLVFEASPVKESINVNGFQVLPSQVDVVRCIFEKHPDMALGFRIKNRYLKTAYMNVLLSLIEILCQMPQEISKDDLADAYSSLGSMKEAGLKLDWLEKKVNEVSEKKEKEEAYETRMQEIEEELKDLKAKVLAARTPLTFDDVF